MTPFEEFGVNVMRNTSSRREADLKFEMICMRCCKEGQNIPCERCSVAEAYNTAVWIHDFLKETGGWKERRDKYINSSCNLAKKERGRKMKAEGDAAMKQHINEG